jgi:hypothetical protein
VAPGHMKRGNKTTTRHIDNVLAAKNNVSGGCEIQHNNYLFSFLLFVSDMFRNGKCYQLFYFSDFSFYLLFCFLWRSPLDNYFMEQQDRECD